MSEQRFERQINEAKQPVRVQCFTGRKGYASLRVIRLEVRKVALMNTRRDWLLGSVVVLGLTLSGCAWASKQPTMTQATAGERQLRIGGVSNVRDMGGLKTRDGRRIKAHRLLRGGSLNRLTVAGGQRLQQTEDLRAVVDLRSAHEMRRKPDVRLTGVTYYQDSVVHNGYVGQTPTQFYQGLVTDQIAQRGYGDFLDQLVTQRQGATYFHCTYGKDRTGVAGILVLAALGVSKTTIREEYLDSNAILQADPHVVFVHGHQTRGKRRPVHFVRRVTEKDFNTVFRTIETQYGSMTNYLRHLGLSAAKETKLRQLYLTK